MVGIHSVNLLTTASIQLYKMTITKKKCIKMYHLWTHDTQYYSIGFNHRLLKVRKEKNALKSTDCFLDLQKVKGTASAQGLAVSPSLQKVLHNCNIAHWQIIMNGS